MKCRVCGAALEPRVTDLPFKVGDSSIVILIGLPVLQCRQCGDVELDTSNSRCTGRIASDFPCARGVARKKKRRPLRGIHILHI
jgi:YgiT-type zinc finger domain-containing protein